MHRIEFSATFIFLYFVPYFNFFEKMRQTFFSKLVIKLKLFQFSYSFLQIAILVEKTKNRDFNVIYRTYAVLCMSTSNCLNYFFEFLAIKKLMDKMKLP